MKKDDVSVDSKDDSAKAQQQPCAIIEEVDETFGGEFPPPVPPDFPPQPKWFPGVVKVEFRGNFNPRFLARPPGPDDIKIDGLAEMWKVFNKYRLLWFEPTFSEIPEWGKPEPPEQAPPGRDRFYTLNFPANSDVNAIASELQAVSALVVHAAPAPTLAPPGTPENEPFLSTEQWYISRCRVNAAWQIVANGKPVSGEGVVVADIDWGFKASHEELEQRISLRKNSITGNDIVIFGPRIDHGTAVMGILGAADNNLGIAGFAFGATLWAIQAGKNPSTTKSASWVAGIDFVRKEDTGGKRKVICLEVETGAHGNIEMDIDINKAIKDAIAAGVVVCVPAGNGGKDVGKNDAGVAFDGANSIIVGATEFNDDETINKAAPFSNWGERVTVSAPGDTTKDFTCNFISNHAYRRQFGRTSGATPKVAGTIALMLQVNPNLSHDQIRSILRATGSQIQLQNAAHPIGTFLNAREAVCEALKLAGGSC